MDTTAGQLPPGSDPRPARKGEEGALGIYKFGRGYWVRVMTAIGLGTLFLWAAAWAWNQLTAVNLPMRSWTVNVQQIEASAASGDRVDLVQTSGDQSTKIGTAVVAGVESQGTVSKTYTLRDVAITAPGATMNSVSRLETSEGTSPGVLGTISTRVGKPIFDRVYLQAGVASLLLLTGLGVVYHLVGRKPSSVDFLIATDEEMRKVNWSTRKVIINSTKVVVGVTFILAGYIFLLDLGLKWFPFEWIVH